MLCGVIILLVWAVSQCSSGNILVYIPTPFYSHQVAYTNLWKTLTARGHQITMVTGEPREAAGLHRIIDISEIITFLRGKYDVAAFENAGIFGMQPLVTQVGLDILKLQLSHPEIQELIHNSTKFNFDLVITEVWIPELLSFAKIYKCPSMFIVSIDSDVIGYAGLGNPVHPVLNHDLNVPVYGKLEFCDRILSTIFHFYLLLYNRFVQFPMMAKVANKYFGNYTEVNQEKFLEDTDMLLVNIIPILKGFPALGPNTILVGGGNHLKPIEPLPQDIKTFLDNASEGFIYISLGSNVQSKDLQHENLKTIIDVLRALPYRILWKYESDDLPNVPKHMKLVKWAPQQDILRHPKIKLFISQGGLQSIEEAIFSHVPLIVMPFYGDQRKNAKLVSYREIGKEVSHKPTLNKDEFKDAVLEVINNPKYKESITKIAHLIQDQPMTGLELSVWWTEYLIRNKGAKHLRNPSGGIPFYQFYLLDVLGFFIAVIILSVWIIVVVLKTIVKIIKRISKPRIDKTKKKL